MAQLLSANLLANDLAQARVILAGVGEEAGHLDVPMIRYDRDYNFGGISVEFLRNSKTESDKVRVQLQPLDALISVSRLDLLKLDVEHLELQALRGAEALITQHRPVIYLENDEPEASAPLLKLLYEHGSWAWVSHVLASIHAVQSQEQQGRSAKHLWPNAMREPAGIAK